MDEITTLKKLKFLRSRITTLYFPTYESDYHTFCKIKSGTNCYAYAMQLPLKLSQRENNYRPGFLSNNAPASTYSFDTMIKGIISDCAALGIVINQVDEKERLPEDSYRIALGFRLEMQEFAGWHFMRENVDGLWSEMKGWGRTPNNNEVLVLAKKHFPHMSYYRLSDKR